MRRRSYKLTNLDGTVAINFDNKTYTKSLMDLGSIEANLATYIGAGQAGQTITSRNYGTRDIEIQGYVLGDSEEEMKSRKATLQKVIVPTTDFYLVIDDRYRLRITATSTLQYETDWYLNCELLTKFTIEGTCSNPFFETIQEQQASITGWIKDFHFPYCNPVGQKFTFGHRSTSKIVDLNNESEVATGMIISFKAVAGTIINPTLMNVNTGELFKLEQTIQSGDEVRIDTGYGTKSCRNVTLDENWLQYVSLDSVWLQMPVGLSSFRYDYDEESTGTLECNVYYTPQLIEV